MLLKKPVSNTLFGPVSSQASEFRFVEDFYAIVYFVNNGDFGCFKCSLKILIPIKSHAGFQ